MKSKALLPLLLNFFVSNFRLLSILALAFTCAQTSSAIVARYEVVQDFVDGEGDYGDYLDDGVDFNMPIMGGFAFEIPGAHLFSAGETRHYRAESILTPLALSFGGAVFNFTGAVDFCINYAEEHIRIDFFGQGTKAVFNFFGPGMTSNPAANLAMLSNWAGYLDFYHENGSLLYSDYGRNVRDSEPGHTPVPDSGSTAALLALASLGIAALAKRFRS